MRLQSGLSATMLAMAMLIGGCASSVAMAEMSDAQVAPDNALSFDARLSDYDYAFGDVSFHAFDSQGLSLEMAYVYLPGEADMPVVTLLHGKNFNIDYWKSTADYLQAQGYGVLIPDQIGFGKSSRPTDYQYSFAALASHTHELMASLGIERSIVLGHSMGGMLASRFALMYPDMTSQLILLNPIGLENYLQYAEYKDTDFFFASELAKTAEGIKAYQQKNYYDGAWNEDYAALTDHLVGQAQGPDAEAVAWVNAKTYDMIFTQPVVTEFDDLTMPTALVLGTRDRTGPGRNWKRKGVTYELGRYDRLGKEMVALIPDARLIEIEGVGHLPHIEAFDRFTAALDQLLPGADGS